MNSFHNTISLPRPELSRAERRARTQEEDILEFFMRYPGRLFTPADVLYLLYADSATPITSVRRAMSNLTRDGRLTKTDVQHEGRHGVKNHCWKYEPVEETRRLF